MTDDCFNENLHLLNGILGKGIEKLLNEAKKCNYVEAPYGRNPLPTPLISEADFVCEGGLQSNNSDPDFNFEYGFDPLKYLADYISWAHPKSVEERRQKKIEAVKFLTKRSIHAKKQLKVAMTLQNTYRQFASGIFWGPYCSPVSSTSIICVCKPLKLGTVVFQVFDDPQFLHLVQSLEVKSSLNCHINSEDEIQLNKILPLKVSIQNLQAGTLYYVRCSLRSEVIVDNVAYTLFSGADGEFFQSSECWTAPSDELTPQVLADDASRAPSMDSGHVQSLDVLSSPVSLLCVGQLPLGNTTLKIAADSDEAQAPWFRSLVDQSILDKCPLFGCLLGDVFAPSPERSAAAQVNEYAEDIGQLYLSNESIFGRNGLFRHVPMMLGWRDRSAGSRYSLIMEELAHRQYLHELKKYQKKHNLHQSSTAGGKRHSTLHGKSSSSSASSSHLPPPPIFKRAHLTNALQGLIHAMPFELNEVPQDYDSSHDHAHPPAKTGAGHHHHHHKHPVPKDVKGCCMLYRTLMLGPDLQVWILDMRGAASADEGSVYLGKEQSAWLLHTLENSSAIWKVIFCGFAFGAQSVIPPQPRVDRPGSNKSNSRRNSKTGSNPSTAASALRRASSSGVAQESKTEDAVAADESDISQLLSSASASNLNKQVQLQVPGALEKAASVKDKQDDVYGRSLYSLQHVLAELEHKLPKKSLVPAEGVISVSSGVVIVSNGVSNIVSFGCADAGDAADPTTTVSAITHDSFAQDEAPLPTFVASFETLNSAPASAHTEQQLLSEAYLKPEAFERLQTMSFAVEVCLGNTKSTDMGCKPSDEARSKEESLGEPEVRYLSGFRAHTHYHRAERVAEAPSSAAVACQLRLSANATLSLQLIDTRCAAELFTCELFTSIDDVKSDDEGSVDH